ncbi:hypothetical protein CHS0354_019065 [Potamilus streckersoni]|uniref:Uncharacterized protein n=1 Tax=Potamilus streckersoni TaxID=2493646 RepID=A0AAE0T6P1_9BIVA|nr:hypothetical protein CHS0354_019065 [Potamilus streckersoni]
MVHSFPSNIYRLGADHDGDGEAASCSSADHFIMSKHALILTNVTEHTDNYRLFSNCSVESFKRTLVNRWCLASKHVHDQDILDEQKQILMKHPGERFTLNEQCQIIYGHRSFFCGKL